MSPPPPDEPVGPDSSTVTPDSPTCAIPVRVEAGPEETPAPAPAGAPRTARVAGRYVVQDEIGRGGMGVVYRAFDRDLRRHVAMKVMPVKLGDERELAARFVEEAQATAQLQHPGIVPVYEIGLDAEGRLFFAMKLVRGRTLAQVVGDARGSGAGDEERFTLFRLLQAFVEVARAVSYAHERGVVHRDLKPQNIMLGRHGEVHVMDWGLAKVLAASAPGAPPAAALRESGGVRTDPLHARTQQGTVVGTPAYMPPEQAGGDPRLLSPLADVYALGATLFHVLDGRRAVTVGEDQTVRLWQVAPPPGRVLRHAAGIFSLAVDAAGRRAASAGADETTRVWDLETGAEVFATGGGGVALADLRPDGRRLAVAAEDGTLRIFDIETRKEVLARAWRKGGARVRFDAEGRRVAGASLEGDVRIWDADTGREVRTLAPEPAGAVAVLGLAFAPDGRFVAAVADATVRVWDVDRGEQVALLEGHGEWVGAVAFAPDGRRLASGAADGALVLWDWTTGRRLGTLTCGAVILHIEFAADGRSVAWAAADGCVRVADVASWREVLVLRGHDGPVAGVAFADGPLGRRLVSAGRDGTLRVFDLAEAERLLAAPPAAVLAEVERATGLELDGVDLVTAPHDRLFAPDE